MKYKPRYRVKSWCRVILTLLVTLLLITGIVFLAIKLTNPSNALLPSPPILNPVSPEPTLDSIPTPTAYPVPEGKSMDRFLVIIDPGHGGRDGGTISSLFDGLYEKDIVLDISKRVKSILEQRGIDVALTREEDMHLKENSDEDLIARWSFANDLDASLYVSVHVNAYDGKGSDGVHGMEVYYYEDKFEIYEDFTQLQFAEIMKDAIINANNINFRFLEGGRQLAVVRNTQMPAVLIEMAYITQKDDHARLQSDEFRRNTAIGIANGIELAMHEIGVFEHQGELYVFKEIGE